jgi:formate dehydrogenase subunit delta
MMDSSHLLKMANNIGSFFEPMPDRLQATRDVVSHIQRFWEPRMQLSLLEHIKTHGDEELKEIVREAFKQIQPVA